MLDHVLTKTTSIMSDRLSGQINGRNGGWPQYKVLPSLLLLRFPAAPRRMLRVG